MKPIDVLNHHIQRCEKVISAPPQQGDTFFSFLPDTADVYFKGMLLIHDYAVNVSASFRNGKMKVFVTPISDNYNDYRLCEMAFQINFTQVRDCPTCGSHCGHLTFKHFIG